MNPDITPAAKALAEQFPWGCKVYPATAERMIQDAFNAERQTALVQAKEENARLREALEFYANPDTYFAIMFMGDSPCGDFAQDLSEVEGDFGKEIRPGNRARQALSQQPNQTGGEPCATSTSPESGPPISDFPLVASKGADPNVPSVTGPAPI